MNTSTAYRASGQRPCPVCGTGSKGCSANADGSFFCRGEPLDGWKCVKRGDTFGTYRPRDEQRAVAPAILPFLAPPQSTNWVGAAERFAKRLTDEQRERLAADLELPASCLAALPLIGYLADDRDGPCFTFPECDAAGAITALNRRYAAGGAKKVMQGGRRGLTLPAGWRDRPGPLLIAEGGTCALAGAAAGLAVIGRPSNTGGVDLLARLLKDDDRELVVLGENDEKDDGTWPGGEGKKVAEKLAAALGRPVGFALPPPEAKDLRAWVVQLAPQTGTPPDYALVGREVLARLRDQVGEPPPAPPSRYRFIDAEEFRRADYRVEWYAEWFLAKGQPAVFAGPPKGMKTSALVDLGVSFATATPHLGKWAVPRRVKVAIVSGESGGFTLQETFFRVLRAKGLPDNACDGYLKWEFTLPTFADLIDTADFADQLGALGCELVVIDPFYLCLGDVDAKNLFEMGRALRAVAELLLTKHGVTPIICHHSNRLLPAGEVMELQHLAYSGLEQFARQYVFLSRRSAYRNDGHHDLWYRFGGSAGHSGLHVLTIDEGVLGPDNPVRRWDVTVEGADQSAGAEAVARKRARTDKKVAQDRGDEAEVLAVIDAEAKKGLPGAAVSCIHTHASLGRDRIKGAIERMVETGALVKVPEFKRPSGNGAMTAVKDGFGRPAEG